MLPEPMAACPKCGDTTEGYKYIVTQRYTQYRGWSHDEQVDMVDTGIGVDHHGSHRCVACNFIVKPRE